MTVRDPISIEQIQVMMQNASSVRQAIPVTDVIALISRNRRNVKAPSFTTVLEAVRELEDVHDIHGINQTYILILFWIDDWFDNEDPIINRLIRPS